MTPHPEPPANCPFFRRASNDGLLFSPTAFAAGHQHEINLTFPPFGPTDPYVIASRYSAACVAIAWMDSHGIGLHRAWWEVYCDNARAEMETTEASNG